MSAAGSRVDRERWTAGRTVAAIVAGIALPLVLAGAVVALFFNPVWVSFEQGRSQVDAITGYSPAVVASVTGGILHDVTLGPPAFDQTVDGQPVLNAREREHMVNVHDVLLKFATVVLVALVALVLVATRGRRTAWFWSAVAWSMTLLTVAVIVVGAFFAVAFDAAFELFHRLLFPAGSYDFDPRTNRLVQLFPDQFWSDTSIAIAIIGLAAAVAIALVARALARRYRTGEALAANLGLAVR